MSFLNIRGKMVHCTKCGTKTIIEYEGGDKPTQIGDLSVIEQLELNQQLMPSDYDFDQNGYYYHVGGVCINCIKKQHKLFKRYRLLEPNDSVLQYIQLLGRVDEKVNSMISKVIETYLKELNADVLERVNPESFKEMISKKTLGIKKEKVRRSNQFVDESKDRFIKDIEKTIMESNEYKEIKNIIKNKSDEQQIRNLLKFRGYIYIKLDLEAEENLNPYICAETTVRKPYQVHGEKQMFNGPVEIDKDRVVKAINNKNEYYLDEINLNDEFKYHIDRLMKKIPHKMIKLDFWDE